MSENVHRRQGSPAALVASLFGIAGRSVLPGPAVVALLGDLGLAPAAARRALARMREAGQLTTVRRGRVVDHHLAGAFGASVLRLRDDRGRAPSWDGAFHALLHQVPESARPYRDRLRRAAVLVGYGPWQPGVLISPVDRSAALRDVLADAPPEATVVLGRLRPDDGSVPAVAGEGPPSGTALAAAMARRAWTLDELADDLRVHVARLTALTDSPVPTDGADALRRLSDGTGPVYVDLLRDPGLPTELLPDDWPGDDLRRQLGRVVEAFLPTVVAHVHGRIAGRDEA
ncbi:PaaX family transcriptional regulator C-terminal domain-containing protein [Actinomycetospora termitidis]|uniref:PaaX family transcriptional regulator C-terminal domain-containing protein n=1 Tax=Actinomycetospora termitidis TaxID=3053470 RepID=A0ABT7MDV3_9PSEU|nr:PaaX family transcriptional regulator C-terminal domain-containing protein [Actinomycetospora sp. Odt1-22]MDL5158850.1 PaaX family transcriptional regulator C-terminal domain-containing protein [Actinomycetospora sp. Odt1-22]